MGYQPEEEPDDPKLKFYKSRARRSVMPTMDGKTPIYNFDDWYVVFSKLLTKSQGECEWDGSWYSLPGRS